METSAAGNTVKLVLPVIEPYVTLMVTVATPNVCADPELSIGTFVESEEAHPAAARSCESPLLKTPVAVKLWLIPSGTEVLSGVLKIDKGVGAVPSRLAEPWMDPTLAGTVAVLIETPGGSPVF